MLGVEHRNADGKRFTGLARLRRKARLLQGGNKRRTSLLPASTCSPRVLLASARHAAVVGKGRREHATVPAAYLEAGSEFRKRVAAKKAVELFEREAGTGQGGS